MQNQPLHSISGTSCVSSALLVFHTYAVSSCRQIELAFLEGLCTGLHWIALHHKHMLEGLRTQSRSYTCSWGMHSHKEELDLNIVLPCPQGTMKTWTGFLSAKGFNQGSLFAEAEHFLCYLTISWMKKTILLLTFHLKLWCKTVSPWPAIWPLSSAKGSHGVVSQRSRPERISRWQVLAISTAWDPAKNLK